MGAAMNIPCPSCQAPITPGMQFCTSCGASLLLEAGPGSAEAVCAVHPERRSLAACTRCGSFSCAECLRQGAEGEPVCAACDAREPAALLAWDRREELGTLRAYWETCMDVLFRPGPTFQRMRPHGSMGSSLFFAMLCNLASFFTTGLLYAGVLAVFPFPETAENDNVSVGAIRAMGAGMFLVFSLLAPLGGVVATLISSAVDHLLLKLGGAERPLEVTMRANAISQAPLLLGLIPICSLYIAPFWVVGLRVFAYRSLHRTSWGKAVLGALAVPLLVCCGCGGFYAMILAMSGRFAS
jgi:hypothetical protein